MPLRKFDIEIYGFVYFKILIHLWFIDSLTFFLNKRHIAVLMEAHLQSEKRHSA